MRVGGVLLVGATAAAGCHRSSAFVATGPLTPQLEQPHYRHKLGKGSWAASSARAVSGMIDPSWAAAHKKNREQKQEVQHQLPAGPLEETFRSTKSPVVLFDGECNFCSGSAWFMIENSSPESMRFAAQSGEVGLGLLEAVGEPAEEKSILVLESDGTLLRRSDAALFIASRMAQPFPIMAAVGSLAPFSVRDACYEWVSQNRYAIGGGEAEYCRIPEDDEYPRFLDLN